MYYDVFLELTRKKHYNDTRGSVILFTRDYYKGGLDEYNALKNDYEVRVGQLEHNEKFKTMHKFGMPEIEFYEHILAKVKLNKVAKDVYYKAIRIKLSLEDAMYGESPEQTLKRLLDRQMAIYEPQGYEYFQCTKFDNVINQYFYKI